jgi:hypothetical protein
MAHIRLKETKGRSLSSLGNHSRPFETPIRRQTKRYVFDPKRGRTPVKRSIQPGSISVAGLPPGLSGLVEGSKEAQVFHYPTMLMLHILRKTHRGASTGPPKPKSAAQVATVQLHLECPKAQERRTYSASRLRQILEPRRQRRIPSPQLIPLEEHTAPDSPEAFQTALPIEKSSRRTIFVRREGCVRYSIPDIA